MFKDLHLFYFCKTLFNRLVIAECDSSGMTTMSLGSLLRGSCQGQSKCTFANLGSLSPSLLCYVLPFIWDSFYHSFPILHV